jgi:hypothetical protein
MKVDAENTHQANANEEEHAHDYKPDDDFEEIDDWRFDEHGDVKDDVNQAFMQALNKLSSGYNQATGDADLAIMPSPPLIPLINSRIDGRIANEIY